MADNIIAGLFGLSPFEIQQRQNAAIQQQANAYAQQSPFERAASGMYQAGAGVGQIGAGMMGMVNPEVEAAKQREAALGQVDFNTPEGILSAAKAAGERGDTRMSLQLQMLARQRMAEQSAMELQAAKTRKEEMLAEEAPRLRHEEKLAEIAQRAEAARMRSEDMRLSAQMRADALRESNELKRMLVEQKLSSKTTEKEQKDIIASDSIRVMLDAAQDLSQHPGREAATGKSAIFNPIAFGTDRADFLAKLDTFKAQTFIPMVSQLKGMGALSDAEGKKLTDAVGALSTKMTEKGFDSSLNGIMNEMKLKYKQKTGKNWSPTTTSSLQEQSGVSESPKTVLTQGSVVIGKTPQGQTVYQSPDGKKWVQ